MENLSQDQQNILNKFKQANIPNDAVKVKVIADHPNTKEAFPLGFETVYYKRYTTEDKLTKGWWTNMGTPQKPRPVWVEDVFTPKGTFIDIAIIGANGGEYSFDWFHNCTGKSASNFLEKIK